MPFSNIIAHDSVIHILKSAYVHNRIPSAYLFIGIPGVGKSLIAKTFSKMVNCESHVTCNICTNCRLMDNHSHPDFITIEPEGLYIKIGQIHQVQEQLSLRPSFASKRVVLIKNANRFNKESANAFLKTLEEPPLDTLLILTATDEDELPETIRSRCQKIVIPPLKKEHLRTIISEKMECAEEDMDFILSYSYGGVRRKLIQNSSQYRSVRDKAINILENLATGAMVCHSQVLEELVAENNHLFFLECCKNWFRDLVFIKNEQNSNLHNQDILPRLRELQNRYSDEMLEWGFNLTVETEKAIQYHAGRILALEALLIQYKQIFSGKPVI